MTTATKPSEQSPSYCKRLSQVRRAEIIAFLLSTQEYKSNEEAEQDAIEWNRCNDHNLITTANYHRTRLHLPKFQFAFYSQNKAGKEARHVL